MTMTTDRNDIPKIYELGSLPATLRCEHGVLTVDYDEDSESPRAWVGDTSRSTFYTWMRGYVSPDERPRSLSFEDVVAKLLADIYDDEDDLVRDVEALRKGAWQGIDCDGEDVYDFVANEHTMAGVDLISRHIPFRIVYALIHSDVAYSTSPFGDPWDSGVAGCIFMDKDVFEEDFVRGVDGDRDRAMIWALGWLDDEVGQYDQWARGEVYRYDYSPDEGPDDSCGGFYGDDAVRDMLLMAGDRIDAAAAD